MFLEHPLSSVSFVLPKPFVQSPCFPPLAYHEFGFGKPLFCKPVFFLYSSEGSTCIFSPSFEVFPVGGQCRICCLPILASRVAHLGAFFYNDGDVFYRNLRKSFFSPFVPLIVAQVSPRPVTTNWLFFCNLFFCNTRPFPFFSLTFPFF